MELSRVVQQISAQVNDNQFLENLENWLKVELNPKI